MRKVSLIILDGVGINEKNPEENSITQAHTPKLDKLFSNLSTRLDASGRAVGLPEGQMGNSEVGHITIGAWKIIMQNIIKIDDIFTNKEFEKIEAFKKGIQRVRERKTPLHIMTIFWPWWLHSHTRHLESILAIIPQDITISLHLFSDGRDVGPKSMIELFTHFKEKTLSKYPNIIISSLGGRYWGMDRDNNWERVKKWYDSIVFGANETSLSLEEYLEKSYEKWVDDEFIEPCFFAWWKKVQDSDTLFFLNFRSDRARQITKAFVEIEFDNFERKVFSDLYFVAMTKYYKEYAGDVLVIDDEPTNILGEILERNRLTQLHIGETEKFAHVTKFFNGGKMVVFEWEKDILIPSHKVSTYDLDPKMSASEIYDEYEKNTLDFDFSVVNIANGDMVGHTAVMEAGIQAMQEVDKIVGKIMDFCKTHDIDLLISADHGNCEEIGSSESPKTAHTTNDVPFWYIKNGEVIKTKSYGWLSNIAPTILEIMWVEKPEWMEESLLLK